MTDICGVYIIKSLESGRVYVGSSKLVAERIKYHIKFLNAKKHHNKILMGEWEKFGPCRFEFRILEICASGERRVKELEWCDKYNSFDRAHGFNVAMPVSRRELDKKTIDIHLDALMRLPIYSRRLLIFLALQTDGDNDVSFWCRDKLIAASAVGCSEKAVNVVFFSMLDRNVIHEVGHKAYRIDKIYVSGGPRKRKTSEHAHFLCTGRVYTDGLLAHNNVVKLHSDGDVNGYYNEGGIFEDAIFKLTMRREKS